MQNVIILDSQIKISFWTSLNDNSEKSHSRLLKVTIHQNQSAKTVS